MNCGDDSSADKVVLDCDLDAPPEKVWRALTEPHLLAAWLTDGAKVDCEVLAVEPGRQVSYSWREASDQPGEAARETIVTFAGSETASGGAHLRLVHQYFGDMMPISRTVCTRSTDGGIGIVSPKTPPPRRRQYRVPGIAPHRAPTTMRWAA
jgi:uncharacterized protein YndB with AHSA1/START domain